MSGKLLRRDRAALWSLRALAVYGLASAVLIGILNPGNPDPDERAIVFMGLSLIAIWCVLGGSLMFRLRARFTEWARSIRINWKVRFVALSIVMALLEEVVTTSLTNLAPYYGAVSEAARITVSTNYFEVISNSVLAFVPWLICWSWLLGRYDFKPLDVMLFFGLTGLTAESTFDGTLTPEDLAGIGMWVFVYGLMVYLPAFTVPDDRGAQPVRWYHIPVAIFLPLIFIIPFSILLLYRLTSQVLNRFVHLKTGQRPGS